MVEVHYMLCALMVTVLAYVVGFCAGLVYHHWYCKERAHLFGHTAERVYNQITEIGD